VVIALVFTPEGFPLGYAVLPGNTLDKQTLSSALASLEKQYGKARRVWVLDRGIPTEETLGQLSQSDPMVSYVVGTPKGRFSQLGGRADRAAVVASARGYYRQTDTGGGTISVSPVFDP
jgi:hypothetical protein